MADPLTAFITQAYFGNTILQYVQFVATIFVFVAVGKTVSHLITTRARKITDKTKNKFDDLFLDIIEKPMWLVTFIAGLVVGYQFLSFPPGISQIYYNTLNVLFVLVTAWFLIRFVDGFLEQIVRPMIKKTDSKLDDQLAPVLGKVTKISIVVIASLIVVSNFGYDVTAVVAGLGIGGLAFAFAAKETISDVFGGISIFASKPFIVGERIEIGKVVGTVEEVGIRHTRLRNLDKRMVIIPNSKVANSVIINVTSAPQRKCVWHLGVKYDTPVEKLELAKKLIIDAINSHPECEDDPIVAFEEFADFSLKILVIFYTKKNDFKEFVKARDAIGIQIKRDFKKAKIGFAFPTQTIHLEK